MLITVFSVVMRGSGVLEDYLYHIIRQAKTLSDLGVITCVNDNICTTMRKEFYSGDLISHHFQTQFLK